MADVRGGGAAGPEDSLAEPPVGQLGSAKLGGLNADEDQQARDSDGVLHPQESSDHSALGASTNDTSQGNATGDWLEAASLGLSATERRAIDEAEEEAEEEGDENDDDNDSDDDDAEEPTTLEKLDHLEST